MMPPLSRAAGRLRPTSTVPHSAVLFALVLTLLCPGEARASFLSPELEDKLANIFKKMGW